MQPGQPNPYGLTCSRCGSALELPADLNAVHCDCRYCGLDNVLPQQVIDARQHLLLAQQREQAAAQAEADKVRARAAASKTAGQALIVVALVGMAFIGSCVLLVGFSQREQAQKEGRGRDVVREAFATLRKKGCDRIVLEPATNREKVSLDLVDGGPCVHLVAATGTVGNVKLQNWGVSAGGPMPDPAPIIDYRACAYTSGNFTFQVEAFSQSFAVGAIECPRLPTEKSAKTEEADLKKVVAKRVDDLKLNGCTNIVQDTTVSRGAKNFRVTFDAKDDCYNFLIGTDSTETTFVLSLTDPSGTKMPVPDPGREMRLIHCPTKAGDYTLTIQPSKKLAEYAYASVECPRDGREGLKRERDLRGLRGKTAEQK